MPPEDADKDRGHKFPFLASEMFNCEVNAILEKFFEAPEVKESDKSVTESKENSEEVEHIETEEAEPAQGEGADDQ